MAKLRNVLCLALAFFVCAAEGAEPKKKTKRKPSTKSATPRASPRPSPALLPGELPLAAQGAVVIDGLSGHAIYEKNAHARLFPASTTKILTALLVIEAGNLEQKVVVDADDAKVPESGLNLKVGEEFTRTEMLYGLMLKSANDVANALARDNAGSVETFAAKMTSRARELGAISSRFTNPHGLHHPEHYTTPHDLSLISRAALEQPLFRQIVSTLHHTWPRDAGIPLRNHNRLLTEFPDCTGVKTGYTRPAQQVLVSSALRQKREVISVIMHSNRPGIWEDSKLLLTHAFANLPERGATTPP